MDDWLVVWNMNFIFHILGMSSSQLTFRFFRGIETTNQLINNLVSTLSFNLFGFRGPRYFPVETSFVTNDIFRMNIHERVVKELYYDMAARLATSSDNHGKVSVLSMRFEWFRIPR